MFLIMSAICVCLTQSNWVMVDSSFGQGFANNSWFLSINCHPFERGGGESQNNTCLTNSIKYVRLKKVNARMDKIIQKKSFQSQAIVDIFFDDRGSASDKQAYFTLNYTVSATEKYKMQFRDYFNNQLTQSSRRICNSSGSGNFDFMTYVGTSTIQYKEQFNISIGIESQDDLQLLGVRNVFVYVKFCQQTCKTCSSSTSCDTCYSGTLQANGFCLCDPAHQFAEVGWMQIRMSDNVCVPDRRIKSFVSYFTSTSSSYSPFQFVPDTINTRSSTPSFITSLCSNNYVGSLLYGEGMSLQMAEQQNIKFIRLRVTFFIQGFLTNSRIQIILDDQVQGEIIKSLSIFDFNQITKIYSSSTICSGSTYEILRIEAILRTYSSTPKLILKGKQLTFNNEIWGFRNVTIDIGNCKENCAVCSDFSTCQQCETGYVLFQNGCVSSCPVHSSNCIDYEDMIPFSRYLAKGFYNLNMTTDDINKFYSETIPTGSNFLTGQKFSIFPTKFVLGGVMVWNNAIYKKSWVISKPHYAVTIRFNVTYGDLYAGNFYYSIQSVKSIAHPIPASGGQNIIGKSSDERTKYFEIFQNPFLSSQLDIELQCTDTNVNAIDQFCALSDYFIVVHYCLPFCENCNDGTSCNTWESGYSSSNCLSNQFLYFDLTTETYNCITCNQVGCLACKNLEECITCDSSSQYNTLKNGVCLSINPPQNPNPNPNPTIECNIYCETCTGTLINNCLTCVSDFHRSLQNNQCQCQSGFSDDGINLYCLPICGDLFIVEGEDCDDGNNNPYDGCHNCKLGCDTFCNQCLSGFCIDCQRGFQMINNQCFGICGDNLLVDSEECEDNNDIPNDGCYNCKFQCPNNCIDCQYNKCMECDEQNGWYLNNNNCVPICGDGIIAIQYEQCDEKCQTEGKCHFCYFLGVQNCSKHNMGICLECYHGYNLIKLTNSCIFNLNFSNSIDINDNKNLIFQEPLCGDGILNEDYEECDDLNDTFCFQCFFNCQNSCSTCYNGKCYQCNQGWILNIFERICYPIQGDKLIVGNEQCDDGNQIEQDGCFLSQFQCQNFCEQCQMGLCLKCQTGYMVRNDMCEEITSDGQIVGIEQCDDQNLNAWDGCFQNRYDCPLFCLSCVNGKCLECNKAQGYGRLDVHNNKCQSVCEDGIKSVEEYCDDGNEIPYDGCYQCKYSCDFNCIDCQSGICEQCQIGYYLNRYLNSCFSICGDGIVTDNESCDNGNMVENYECSSCQIECQPECFSCYQGQCYSCENQGWEIDLIQGVCNSKCGDGIIVGKEQCDDGNEIENDGCYQCEFQCQEQCTKCLSGFCIECDTPGWILYENYCVSYCGDLIVVDKEECDDGNTIPYDGCFQCQFQCQFECTDCQSGVCYECGIQGWQLTNSECQSVCGDGYIVQFQEECDDGNFLKYDGCYQCQFQCQEMCTLCQLGICYECDYLGWMIENHVCKPFCGDGIVLGYEQCDDMNDNKNDGCHLCQFACDQYCIDCQQGICQQCELGRFLSQNVCLSQCGDGNYVKSVESCDDGNVQNGDGCDSNCKVETNYLCKNVEGSFSFCAYSKQPQFQLTVLPNYFGQFQDVQINFDQKMKYSQIDDKQLFSLILFEIINFENTKYFVEKQLIKKNPNQEISDITIHLRVNFYAPIERPILKVSFLDDVIVSEYDLPLKESVKTTQLLSPAVLSQTQINVAQSAAAFNEAVIYFLIGLSSICLLTGSSELFWNLMDQLQYLSYVKYVNILFPPNLDIYFEVFKMITIEPIFQALRIDSFFNLIYQEEYNQPPTDIKFLNDDINVHFFANFKSFLFCMIGAYLGHFLQNLFTLFLYKIQPYILLRMNFTIAKLLYQIRKKCLQQSKEFFYNGILRIVMSNAFDISFAMTIQIAYFQNNSFNQSVTSYISLVVFTFYISVIIYIFNILQKLSKQNTLKNRKQYEALLEEVRDEKNVWIAQYNSIQLIKKFIFICLIVFMQKEGKLQSLLIATNETLFLSYFILNKPLRSYCEQLKIIVTESITIINTVTFILYDYFMDIGLSQSFRINLGWFHIITFSAILSTSLIIDVYQQFKVLGKKLRQIFCNDKQQEELQASSMLFV